MKSHQSPPPNREKHREIPICPKCGSKKDWDECDKCNEGYVEADIGDDVMPQTGFEKCYICDGLTGWYRCFTCYPLKEEEL